MTEIMQVNSEKSEKELMKLRSARVESERDRVHTNRLLIEIQFEYN